MMKVPYNLYLSSSNGENWNTWPYWLIRQIYIFEDESKLNFTFNYHCSMLCTLEKHGYLWYFLKNWAHIPVIKNEKPVLEISSY